MFDKNKGNIYLDGALTTKKDLRVLMKEAKKNGMKIVKVEEGVYKTLKKLED